MMRIARKRAASALLWIAPFVIAVGYWGPWLPARSAGNTLLGVDLPEVVKLLPEVRFHGLRIWREGFYLPLFLISLSWGALAWRRDLAWPLGLRILSNLLAAPAALSLLPPAWSPGVLWLPEFRQQSAAIIVLLVAAVLSYPALRLLPQKLCAGALAIIAAAALAIPPWLYQRATPALVNAYDRPVDWGWGIVVSMLGYGILLIGLALWTWNQRRRQQSR